MSSSVLKAPTSLMSSLRQEMGCMPQLMPCGSLMAVVGSRRKVKVLSLGACGQGPSWLKSEM